MYIHNSDFLTNLQYPIVQQQHQLHEVFISPSLCPTQPSTQGYSSEEEKSLFNNLSHHPLYPFENKKYNESTTAFTPYKRSF